MSAEHVLAAFGIFAGTFVVAVLSSVFPLASIEVFLVGLAISRPPTFASAILLVVCAALGQLVGKLPIYLASRKLGSVATARMNLVHRMLGWFTGRHTYPVLIASTVLGLPPFSLMATAAGMLAIPARRFCMIVGLGRAARFALLLTIATRA